MTCLVTSIGGAFLLGFSQGMYFDVFGMWLLIFGLTIPLNMGYVIITEMVEEGRRQQYKTIFNLTFTLGAIYVVLWFYLLRNYEDVIYYCYGLPLIIITAILLVIYQDTPISMITKSEPEKVYNSLMFMAKINGKTNMTL